MTARKSDIALQRITYLAGPNIWTYRAAMEVWLDLGELEAYPSNLLPGFVDRLLTLLPGIGEHKCGVGDVGAFAGRLLEGTWAGHVLEHCVIELLNLAGMPTGFGQTRSTSQTGVYRMVFRARDETVGRVALAQAHALLMAAINGDTFEVSTAVAEVHEAIESNYLGPSTACIVAAATDLQIPHIRLNDGNLVQLGYGECQHRIWTAETDRTCAIAEGIAGDKDLTKMLLKACGIPVPEGVVVASADEAWAAAQEMDGPVAIKPSDGNHGRGVTLDLVKEQDIRAAFEFADRHGSEVLVEKHIPGDEHRLLVVGGKVVAAARGESAWIVGDGQHTVSQLVDEQINSDPRRGSTEAHPLNVLTLSEDEVIRLDLQRQGLSGDAVVAAGRRVLIQRNGNVAIDCTDEVHPEVAFHATLAARVIGLDIAGLDVVCKDIARPLLEQGGAVVEVNAGPGLLVHLQPAAGQTRPVGQAIVGHLFSTDEQPLGRIPVVGIAGSRHTSLIARLVAWLIHINGQNVALACQNGMFLGALRIGGANANQFWAMSQQLLTNRDAQAAVFENQASLILSNGLPYDRCQIGLVTDLDGWQALAHHDISDSTDMIKVMRTQVDVILEHGVAVLNAMDSRISDMADLCDGSVVMYACCDEPSGTTRETPLALTQHVASGGRAALLRHRQVTLLSAAQEPGGVDLYAWLEARALEVNTDMAEAVMAALVTAWAYGISPSALSVGLDSFDPSATLT